MPRHCALPEPGTFSMWRHIMDPKHTALVLIGYQNDYFAADGILHQVIEESSRVTGNLANTVDLVKQLHSTPFWL
jgi:nicotinamidase-related amidase